MSVLGPLGRVLASFLRLVTFALIVGVVVAFLVPGGPVDLGSFADAGGDPGDAGTGTDGGPASTTETATPPDRPLGRSPWGQEVLVVSVRNTAAPSRDVTVPVAEALAYWEENIGYADYTASFLLRPDATNPDVIVWYNESLDCAHHADAIGCAPQLEATSTVAPPVHVGIRYDGADNQRQVRNTVIHELGHVLGVGHCEEPYWVMASTCTEPIPDAPDAAERDLAWRGAEVSVYVDDANVSADERAATAEQVGHALSYFENASDEEFPADVAVVRTDDRFAADVTVTFSAAQECPDGKVACYNHWGRDYDRDGRIEYYTNGRVRIAPGTDVDARGWYVGWSLAHQLSPGNVPSVFEDGGHGERRSEWWE